MDRTAQYFSKICLLFAAFCTGGVAASDTPVIDWLSPTHGSGHAPLAIVISQPAPGLLFTDNPRSSRVQLAITPQPNINNSRAPSQAFSWPNGVSSSRSDTLVTLSELDLFSPAEARALSASQGLFSQDFLGPAASKRNTGPTWSVTVEVEQQLAQSLAAIGQIHCRDGFFSPAGYTASGCQVSTPQNEQLHLGASVRPLAGIELGLGLFQQAANVGPFSQDPIEQGLYNATLLANPLAIDTFIETNSGIDMGLHINTGESAIGRFQLDVAMAEYFDRNVVEQITAYDFKPPWLGQNDLQRQTRLHLGWSKGAFSGGVEGIHQVYQPGLLDTPGNDWSTFNLYFSWQAPWNGRFSIGATNVLDTSLEDASNQQPDPRQPIDGIFGRVPYVRYKHDL